MPKYLTIFFLFTFYTAYSQSVLITGTVEDTTIKAPLENVVVMAIKLQDSLLVSFTRTDANGYFKLSELPIDTYQVVLSHHLFGDQVIFVLGSAQNNVFDFGKTAMPPKSITLNEVLIYGYADPVYYKGDTLIYTADSFKVKQNAVVEDLLKKLPGIKVDSKGKIYSQGTAVDQLLVDGDEFFGSDPTTATKNLSANAVESVQVYDKKNDSPSETGDIETLKIMDLKLKDDAKNGYFGKVSGGTDFNNFYEGELLANNFRKKQKVSVFALASNTPRSTFGWNDVFSYGLNNEMNTFSGDEGSVFYYSGNNQPDGIPQTLKTGFYYTGNLGKKTKVTMNYTYNPSEIYSQTTTTSQYFLSDTTYKTNDSMNTSQRSESHAFNFTINQDIDSLTDIELKSKLQYNTNSKEHFEVNDFLTDAGTLKKSTTTENSSTGNNYNISNTIKLTRNFIKRDRKLNVIYSYNTGNNETTGILKSQDIFYDSFGINDTNNQQKSTSGNNQMHKAALNFTEPLTEKIKLEFNYDYTFNTGIQDKKTLDYANGDYTLENTTYSNNFENTRNAHRLGAKFIYEVKKQRLAIGATARQLETANINRVTQQKISQAVSNILPNLGYRYKFNDNQTFRFNYNTNSNQPNINQLQPVPDNTNPNHVTLGNPDLLPTFSHKFDLGFNTYKPISGKYMWSNINFSTVNNTFANSTVYDSTGKTTTQTINTQGNYTSEAHVGGSIPMFSKLLEINPDLNFNYSNNTNYINNQINNTKQASVGGRLSITLTLGESEFSIGGYYAYSNPVSSLNSQSNKPYTSSNYSSSLILKLPYKFVIESNAHYFVNSQRAQDYNINYLLWNASINKTFLKNETLIASLAIEDILNQNINTSRIVQDNVISDTKTNITGRYFLVKISFKFNSNKSKEEDEF